MAFCLQPQESVEAGIRRIVGEQLDAALVAPAQLDHHQAVHEVRKRCKRIRGALRLVRPVFEHDYRRENAAFRDAARPLSLLRDAEAMIETFDALVAAVEGEVDRRSLGYVRRALTLHRQEMANGWDLDTRLEAFCSSMREARERLQKWSLSADGAKAALGGMARTYRRGRFAMAEAYAEPSAAQFHEWRKRVKYHRYHCRLLRSPWERPMKARWKEVKRLSDLLGDEHDLAVFRARLLARREDFGPGRVEVLVALADRRVDRLRQEADHQGARVYADKPKQLRRRMGVYWDAWSREW
jgi:CHAD domain-containing protein